MALLSILLGFAHSLPLLGGIGAALRGLLGRGRSSFQLDGGEGEELDWRRQELSAENEMLREQIYQLKRLAMNQKDYANGLRKERLELRRLLETTEERVAGRVAEEFMAEKARALKEQQAKHEEERAKWRAELASVKAELASKSKDLDDARVTVASIKKKLIEESRLREKESEALEKFKSARAASQAAPKEDPPPRAANKRDKKTVVEEEEEGERGAAGMEDISSSRDRVSRPRKKIKVSSRTRGDRGEQ